MIFEPADYSMLALVELGTTAALASWATRLDASDGALLY